MARNKMMAPIKVLTLFYTVILLVHACGEQMLASIEDIHTAENNTIWAN